MQTSKLEHEVQILDFIRNSTASQESSHNGNTVGFNPCPICNHNDCFRVFSDTNSWNCFSNDHQTDGGDIYEFIKEYENVDFKEALQMLNEYNGNKVSKKSQNNNIISMQKDKLQGEKAKENLNELVEIWFSNITKTNYFSQRGISSDLIFKYKLGYDHKYNAVTLPCFNKGKVQSVVKRIVEPKTHKYHNEGKTNFFNVDILNSNQKFIFVTEGIFDALSIEEVLGTPAIALNSTSNSKKFIKYLQENNIKDKYFIFIGDNDDAGKKSMDYFSKQPNFNSYQLKEHNDVNDYLQNKQNNLLKTELEEKKNSILNKNFNIEYMTDFYDNIVKKVEGGNQIISTGFNNMDEILLGGLMQGIYVLGAISSLGKTTFTLQMADQIASNGNDVLFFSLEQTKTELISKSISRKIYEQNNNKIINTMNMMTGNINDVQKKLIKESIDNYGNNIAKNMSIIRKARSVKQIRKKVKEVIDLRGGKPVVVIDFLQRLEFPKNIKNYREAVDFNLSYLKELSDDFEIPIIIISSFNRNNYNQEVSFNSFKESGGIEYTADVVIGLQLTKMHNEDTFDHKNIEAWKAEYPRKIQAVILKYRNGPVMTRANFNYFTSINKFEIIN